MTNPEPCPFCGCQLTPSVAAGGSHTVGWSHPGHPSKESCFYAGVFIGSANIEKWDKRKAPAGAVHMLIENGHPRFFPFPLEGSRPVDFDMINRTLQYYKEQAK